MKIIALKIWVAITLIVVLFHIVNFAIMSSDGHVVSAEIISVMVWSTIIISAVLFIVGALAVWVFSGVGIKQDS